MHELSCGRRMFGDVFYCQTFVASALSGLHCCDRQQPPLTHVPMHCLRWVHSVDFDEENIENSCPAASKATASDRLVMSH
jgi:hypothetical protein